jgi:hypothetical protein
MPRSFRSVQSSTSPDDVEEGISNSMVIDQDSQIPLPTPRSPLHHRRTISYRSVVDENSGLLENPDSRSYRSIGQTTASTPRFQRQPSHSTNARFSRNINRGDSYGFSQRLVNALQNNRRDTTNGKQERYPVTAFLTLYSRFKLRRFQILEFLHQRPWLV